MEPIIKVMPNFKKFNSYMNDVKNDINPIMLSGLTDEGKVHFAYATSFYAEKPICIVTYNEIQAKKLINSLKYFTDKIEFFPKREILTYDYLTESKEIFSNRISVLNKIYNKKVDIVVTTIEAVSQKIVPKNVLFKNIIKVKVGQTCKLENIKEQLVNLGYERFDLVEGENQFSIRGGIIDVATSNKVGIRIELWGDEVDSIRYFDIVNQRSTTEIQSINIYPAHEFLLGDSLENICEKIEEREVTAKLKESVKEDIELIKESNYINKVDRYFDAFYEKSENLLDYLKDDFIIFLDEIGKIKARSENIIKDMEGLVESLIEKEKLVPDSIKNIGNYLEFITNIENRQTIYLEKQDIGFVDKKSMHAKRNGYSFSYREVNFFRSSMDVCIEEIQKARKQGKTVIILNENEEKCKKFAEILNEKHIPNVIFSNKKEITTEVIIKIGTMETGFEAYDFDLLVISTKEIFNTPVKKKKVTSNTFKEGETIVFADLKVGDYIVHRSHGIGQFIGVNTIKADNITKDYIKIQYRDDDVLYIPTNALDSIRKYIGGGDAKPKLNRLGGKEWDNTKLKVKNNLKEVAKELIELYARREKAVGYAFSKDTEWQQEFEEKFEYKETNDQLRCIEEAKKDMELQKPMDRLLCGDVGYGKTEIAIRCAFKACMDQKQVAYLVPTTILANQQYEAFKERMKDYPIKIELLNRFRTKKEQEEIIKKLKLGELDIVIGTHRILSKDVEFKELGLLIIDEEHRFGVKDKEKIKLLKTNVDVLTMTATPIPRTLHMSIVGIRDMSVIYEPPQNRKPVQTYVLEYDLEVIKEAITKELERNGQVFYLFNNVGNIIKKAEEIQKLVPEAKVDFAHGKMTGNELEDKMLEFVNKNTNVLVCTTILESGIDIPNANTIIVENADRLGLAQLYQIRGRVGRSDKQAYAYITYKRDKMLNEVAEKRLKTIKEFTEFGSGFKIAMRDLEIRGAGSILGEIQHGHMDSVGYDMYCKLLDEVIKEMKGVEIKEELDVQIDINVSSYIPDTFIENSSEKIEIYQNIAICRTEQDIQNVVDEIIDRYGNMPEEIENLLNITRIKNLCRILGITKVAQKNDNIILYFDSKKFDISIVNELMQKYRNRIKFSPALLPYITFKLNKLCDEIKEIKEFLYDSNKQR